MTTPPVRLSDASLRTLIRAGTITRHMMSKEIQRDYAMEFTAQEEQNASSNQDPSRETTSHEEQG